MDDRASQAHWLGTWSDRLLLAAAALFFLVAAGTASLASSPLQMAIVSFNFLDTSGETTDQRADHATRLQTLEGRLRTDLAASGKFRIIDVFCGHQPCEAAQADFNQSVEQARKAGAKFVLFGAVHKTSTLVLSFPVRVIDTQSGKVVFERHHSFRGDTDEAWQRAARFLARELLAELPGKQ